MLSRVGERVYKIFPVSSTSVTWNLCKLNTPFFLSGWGWLLWLISVIWKELSIWWKKKSRFVLGVPANINVVWLPCWPRIVGIIVDNDSSSNDCVSSSSNAVYPLPTCALSSLWPLLVPALAIFNLLRLVSIFSSLLSTANDELISLERYTRSLNVEDHSLACWSVGNNIPIDWLRRKNKRCKISIWNKRDFPERRLQSNILNCDGSRKKTFWWVSNV